jgi:hypothetical protein
MRLVVTGADGALTSSTFAIGRAGLNALYVEWVGHSPDADNGAPIPICDLLDLVAGALLFNSRQGREK